MKSIVTAICIILISSNCFAQKKLSAAVSGGISDLKEIDNDQMEIGNYYSAISSFKAGVNYDLFKRDSTRFFSNVGLAISAKGAKLNFPGVPGVPEYEAASWIERFYSFDLPIVLNYKFEKFLIIRGGINSSLLFATSNFQGMTEKKPFTFGLLGGGTIRIKRYTLNIEYIYDFSDMLRFSNYDISYRNTLLHFGVGYYF